MKIISFIDDFPVIKKILTYLNLWHIPLHERPPPGRSTYSEDEQAERLRNKDPYADYYFLDVVLGRN